uniref:Uncharacterized protein n=1 Tax=Anguilla anguilla TaxID=7936 RepID=A0A0E9W4A4_ANGAN
MYINNKPVPLYINIHIHKYMCTTQYGGKITVLQNMETVCPLLFNTVNAQISSQSQKQS